MRITIEPSERYAYGSVWAERKDLHNRVRILVNVHSFTFCFDSIDAIESMIRCFEEPHRGGSRYPGANAYLAQGGHDRGDLLRPFQRLPMYLKNKVCRPNVLRALKKARARVRHVVIAGFDAMVETNRPLS